jgi:hypothetical protein
VCKSVDNWGRIFDVCRSVRTGARNSQSLPILITSERLWNRRSADSRCHVQSDRARPSTPKVGWFFIASPTPLRCVPSGFGLIKGALEFATRTIALVLQSANAVIRSLSPLVPTTLIRAVGQTLACAKSAPQSPGLYGQLLVIVKAGPLSTAGAPLWLSGTLTWKTARVTFSAESFTRRVTE